MGRTDGSTGNFQRNRTGFRQRAPNNDQSPAGRNVDSSGKFQRFLAAFVTTPDENGYGKAEPRPLSLLFFGGVRTQSLAVQNKDKPITLPQIGGQTSEPAGVTYDQAKPRYYSGNQTVTRHLQNLVFSSSSLK